MSAALTLTLLAALTLSAANSGRVIRVDTNVYEVPSRAARYIVQDRMDWDQAYRSCKRQNSHLVVINSDQEAFDMTEIVQSETVYVGIHHKFIEGRYVAVTGEELNETGYAKWFAPAPNGGPNKCISYSGAVPTQPEYAGLWDISCTYGLRSICEQRMWSDYELIEPHNYYKLHNTRATWQQAWQTCRQEGAHLLIINSQSEIDSVFQRLGDFRTVWTGIHHEFSLGAFVTVFNEKLESTGYNIWLNPVIDPWRLYVSVLDNIGLTPELNASLYPFICEHDRAQG